MIHLGKVLKISLQDVLKTPSKHLEDVLKMSWRRFCETSEDVRTCLEDIFARRLEDVLKAFWRGLDKTSWRRLENVLKRSWRRMTKTNILVLIQTSWRLDVVVPENLLAGSPWQTAKQPLSDSSALIFKEFWLWIR